MTKTDFIAELKRTFWSSLRLYFAPLVGACNGAYQAVHHELKRIERERARFVSLQPHHLPTFLQQCFNILRCKRQQFIDSAVRPGGEFFQGIG